MKKKIKHNAIDVFDDKIIVGTDKGVRIIRRNQMDEQVLNTMRLFLEGNDITIKSSGIELAKITKENTRFGSCLNLPLVKRIIDLLECFQPDLIENSDKIELIIEKRK